MDSFLKQTVRALYIGAFGIAALSVFIPFCMGLYRHLKQVDVYLLAATAYQEITIKFLIPLSNYLQMITVQMMFRGVISVMVLSVATGTMFRDLGKLLFDTPPSIGHGGFGAMILYIMYCFVHECYEYTITGKVQFDEKLQVVIGSSVIYSVIVIGIWAFSK